MKKSILILVVIVVLILAVFLFKKPSMAPTVSSSPTASSEFTSAATPTASVTASPARTGQTVTITFANGAATPANVTIRVGDTVKFVNNDSVSRWPASGLHPTHQICPGFDSLGGLNTGETYSFTFNIAKTCPWHDHLDPSLHGQIIVNP